LNRRCSGILFAAVFLGGCGTTVVPTTPPVAGTALPSPVVSVAPSPSPTAVPSAAPATVAPTPTAVPTATPRPEVFDSQQFLADVHDETWVKKYPKVSPTKIWAMYQAQAKRNPALKQVVGTGADVLTSDEPAAVRKASALADCFGGYLPSSGVNAHYHHMQEACPYVMARLVWYVNQTSSKELLPLTKAVLGWVAHSEVWNDQATHDSQEWTIAQMDFRSKYLDGTCDPDGLWACIAR
jgi:hypothetical protein